MGNGNEISKPFSHKTSMFSIFFLELSKISFPIKLTLIGVKNQKDIPEIREYFKEQSNIEIEIPTNLQWQNDAWIYPKILTFDLGVSPMNNHLFNKSKSAFKAKQYLSCGIPTAACDVGDNKVFVKNNENGFIINSLFSYADAINKIAEMRDEEYSVLSQSAFKSRNEYSMKKYCSNILTHFRS